MILKAHVYTNMTKLSQNTYYTKFKYLHTLYKIYYQNWHKLLDISNMTKLSQNSQI